MLAVHWIGTDAGGFIALSVVGPKGACEGFLESLWAFVKGFIGYQ